MLFRSPDGSTDANFSALDLESKAALLDGISLSLLEDDRILVGFTWPPKVTSLSQFKSLLRLEPDGQIDTNFVYLGGVECLNPLPGGDMLIGSPYGVSRIHPDGTKDPNFVCQVDGVVSALAVQPDGNILIGGSFKHVNGVSRSNLARIFGTQRASQPFVFGPFLSVGGFDLLIPTIAQYTYSLEGKDAVDSKEWKLLATIVGDGSYRTDH